MASNWHKTSMLPCFDFYNEFLTHHTSSASSFWWCVSPICVEFLMVNAPDTSTFVWTGELPSEPVLGTTNETVGGQSPECRSCD